MWLSRQQKRSERETPVETGEVTLSGETVAVELDSERRGLAVYAPAGYRWRPAPGQKVLVLKTAEGPCVIGTPSGGGLDAGEIGLSADGGAAVTLKTDGRVLLGENVEVSGLLTVGGEELEAKIRRIVVEVVASMLL